MEMFRSNIEWRDIWKEALNDVKGKNLYKLGTYARGLCFLSLFWCNAVPSFLLSMTHSSFRLNSCKHEDRKHDRVPQKTNDS